MSVRSSIQRHEGYRNEPYRDHLGYWTIGYGRNIHNMRLSDWCSQSLGDILTALSRPGLHESWLDEDIDTATRAAEHFVNNFDSLTLPRQEVLIEMAFQMGRAGLNKFVRLKAAVEAEHWVQAANEIFPNSLLASQTPGRARYYADTMLEG